MTYRNRKTREKFQKTVNELHLAAKLPKVQEETEEERVTFKEKTGSATSAISKWWNSRFNRSSPPDNSEPDPNKQPQKRAPKDDAKPEASTGQPTQNHDLPSQKV
jgi:hypothetical protein